MRIMPAFLLSMAASSFNQDRLASQPVSRNPRGSYAGTEPHPIRDELRQRRFANAARNFATGHWQHRVINAVPA